MSQTRAASACAKKSRNATGPRIGFGGDRAIAGRVLEFLLGEGVVPACLVVADGAGATHAEDLRMVLNLQPALLSENRGWHTPSWAILNQTRFGATLHFVSEGIDEGDIVHQRELPIEPSDTADALYQKALDLEFEVFREAWADLACNRYRRIRQPEGARPAHRKKDLKASGELIRRLRALTTNRIEEACYFEQDQTGGELS